MSPAEVEAHAKLRAVERALAFIGSSFTIETERAMEAFDALRELRDDLAEAIGRDFVVVLPPEVLARADELLGSRK